jgi:hypothetical protein
MRNVRFFFFFTTVSLDHVFFCRKLILESYRHRVTMAFINIANNFTFLSSMSHSLEMAQTASVLY